MKQAARQYNSILIVSDFLYLMERCMRFPGVKKLSQIQSKLSWPLKDLF